MKIRRRWVIILPLALLVITAQSGAQQSPSIVVPQIKVGMSTAEVRSVMGKPQFVNKIVLGPEWGYPEAIPPTYVYFEHGKVSRIDRRESGQVTQAKAERTASARAAFAVAVFGVILAVLAYFLPAIVAAKRDHHNRTAIAVLDLLAGWTVVGWIIAMVWACTEVHEATSTD